MRIRRTVVAILLFTGAFVLFSGTSFGGDIEALMAQADAYWPQRTDLSKFKESIALYNKVLEQDPENVEAMWKLTRAHYWLGEHTDSEDEKLAIFEKGTEYAKKGIDLKADCVDCYYWLGVNYGVYGEAKGVLKSLSLIDPIKDAMNKVIELDPEYSGGAAYRVLGRMEYKVPWVAGGSKKESAKYLEKAFELNPNSFLTRRFLAETYLGLKKKDKAESVLEWALTAPEPTDPSEIEDKKKAIALYNEKFK